MVLSVEISNWWLVKHVDLYYYCTFIQYYSYCSCASTVFQLNKRFNYLYSSKEPFHFFSHHISKQTHLPHLLLQPCPIPTGTRALPPSLLAVSQLWSKAACMCSHLCVSVCQGQVWTKQMVKPTPNPLVSVNFFLFSGAPDAVTDWIHSLRLR